MIDYTKLLKKLQPEVQIGGDPGVRLRVGVIDTVNASGTASVWLSGVLVPDVPRLANTTIKAGDTVQIISYRGSLLIIGRSATAASVPLNPRVGTTTGTAGGGTTTATTEGPTDQVTAAVVSGWTYRIRWYMKYTATVANDRFVLRIRTGSGVGGTELESAVFNTGTGVTFTEVIETDWTAAATGNQTFTGTVQRVSGTGTITIQGGPTVRRSFTVDLVTAT